METGPLHTTASAARAAEISRGPSGRRSSRNPAIDAGSGADWLKQRSKDKPEWIPSSARLLGLKASAVYVGTSTWVIRGWLADGVLARVRLPRPGGGEMERLLFDVNDLDALPEAGKGP